MKNQSVIYVICVSIISALSIVSEYGITIKAIESGVIEIIEMDCGLEECRLRLESEAKSLPTAEDFSAETL